MRFVLACLSLLLASPAFAGDLSVDDWLRRPGVKLLAVEFYATWCKPCMAAVPKWKALHERYRAQGLRLVVVSVQDPEGGCVNPGWAPDQVICDDDGILAERFKANKLPSAFLWSWQGDLLVQRGHIEQVQPAILSWMRKTPRVDVEVQKIASGAQVTKAALFAAVRTAIQDQGKLIVVATEAERSALRKIQVRSMRESASEALQCKVGEEITANSLLKVSITGGSRKRLRLSLFSAERGCMVASAVSDWRPKRPSASALEASSILLSKIKRKPQLPFGKAAKGLTSAPPSATFSNLDAELAQAKAQEAQAQKLENDWKTVQRYARSQQIAKAKRVAQLERFLSVYNKNNPHEAEANALLKSLSGAAQPSAAIAEARPRAAPAAPASSSRPRKLSAAALKKVLRRGFGRLRSSCGSNKGKLRASFTIMGRTGRITTAVVTGGTDARLKRCATRWLKKLRFPKFQNRQMRINYPLKL